MGDQIWLCTKDIYIHELSKKLSQKKLGPFIVSRVVNHNAYKLNLLVHLWIWSIFNVN